MYLGSDFAFHQFDFFKIKNLANEMLEDIVCYDKRF